MSDSSVAITPGSGVLIASYTDSIGVNHQKMVLEVEAASGDPSKVNAANPLPISAVSASAGGWIPGSYISTATTNEQNIKASPGQLGFIYISNTSGSLRYVRLYDSATAEASGAGTPVQRYALPAGGVQSKDFGPGMQFLNGISFDITDAAGDTDTTATAAGDVIFNYGFK